MFNPLTNGRNVSLPRFTRMPRRGFPTVQVGLTAGRIGTWWFDQIDTAKRAIPNAESVATPLSANLFRAPRRLFSTSYFFRSGVAATDSAGAAQDGSNDASRLVGSGSWYMRTNASVATSGGTQFIMAAWVKRNAGSDQPFAFSADPGLGTRSVKTATATWTRVSQTFTVTAGHSSNNFFICSSDGSTGADILICDLALYAGAVDLGAAGEPPVGHLYLGKSKFDPNPTYAAGEVNASSGGTGLIQFPSSGGPSFATLTAQALVAKVGNGSGYNAFLSKVQSYAQFTAWTDSSKTPVMASGGETGVNSAGLWDRTNQGCHVITHRYDGTKFDLFLDDLLLLSVTKANTLSGGLADLYFATLNGLTLTSGEKLAGGMVLYASALTDAQVRSNVEALHARAAASGVTSAKATRVMIFEGDSRTVNAATRWPFKFGPNASPAILGANHAVAGASIETLSTGARKAAMLAALPPTGLGAGRKLIAVIGPMGANGLGTYAGATDTIAATAYADAMDAYINDLLAGGYTKVALCTETPTTNATHNTRRQILNGLYRTRYAGSSTVILLDLDQATDAANGNVAPFADDNSFATYGATYWTDGTHHNAAGDTVIEAYVRPLLNAA